MDQYGLPSPQLIKTELQKELLRYDTAEQQIIYETLCNDLPNTDEQQQIFDGVVDAVLNNSADKQLHSVSGIAGSGKTTVADKIAAYLRAQGKIVLICAATSLACQNYSLAYTAHRLFKFPVIDDDDRDMEQEVKCR
jgi:signal recognition particle GTPase